MKPIGVMLKLTLREAARRKVLWGLVLLTLVFLAFYALGLSFVHGQIMRAFQLGRGPRFFSLNDVWNFWLTATLYAANFLIVMMTVLISVDAVAGEISSGTIHAIAAKPLRRLDILLGKWLGFAVILGSYVAVLIGGVFVITSLITGYVAQNIGEAMGLMFLEALVLLCVSFLGGTRLPTLANGVLGFGLFGLAFIGGWMQLIGNFPGFESEAAVTLGQLTSLVMPSEALWRYALSQVSSGANPFSIMFNATTPPDARIVPYAIVFALAMLTLAVLSFQRRDL